MGSVGHASDVEPGMHKIDQPTVYHQNSYGYNTQTICTGPMCLPAGATIECSKPYVKVSGKVAGSKVQFCEITKITIDGNTRDVSSEHYTYATGYFEPNGNFIAGGLPPNDFFLADKYGRPTKENMNQLEAKICDANCGTSRSNKLFNFANEVVKSINPLLGRSPASPDGIPKKFDDYFLAKANAVGRGADLSVKNYNEYKKYFIEAAKAYDLDPALLFCLKDQESHEDTAYVNKGAKTMSVDWYAKAVSSSKAVGLGQLLLSTAKYIAKDILPSDTVLNQQYKKYLGAVGRTEPKSYNFHDIANDSVAATNCDDRCDPRLSVGLAALYLKYIFKEYGSPTENNRKPPNRDYLIYMSGLYNQGPGYAKATMSSRSSPSAWRKSLSNLRGGQVTAHMNKIGKCMSAISN